MDNGAPTCRSGRCIDFAVVSSELAPAIANVHYVNASWKMHDVVGFELLRAPWQFHAKFLVRPRRFIAGDIGANIDIFLAFATTPPRGHGRVGGLPARLSDTPLAFIQV